MSERVSTGISSCGTNKVKYTIKISIIQAKCNNRQQQKIRINTWLIRILLLLFISNYFTSSNMSIISEGAISHSNLRMLLDHIVISEQNEKLSIRIFLKANFSGHIDILDDPKKTARAY